MLDDDRSSDHDPATKSVGNQCLPAHWAYMPAADNNGAWGGTHLGRGLSLPVSSALSSALSAVAPEQGANLSGAFPRHFRLESPALAAPQNSPLLQRNRK